jgi:NifU-like protein involved in Fe-S cluster formation
MLDDLYTSKLLALCAAIPHTGRLDEPQGTATRHARLCGSVVTVDVTVDDDGKVATFAQDVKACALGQASAAVLGGGVIGATMDELLEARDGLRALISGEDVVFDERFSDLTLFAAVRDYKARHASVMLAFEAVVEACEGALDKHSQSAA